MSENTFKPTRIVVIGAGAVGSTTAYTLLLKHRMSELVLIDVNHEKALGDALDMNHGLPFVGGVKVWAGDYSDCAGAEIIIVTAGAAQRPGETRLDLLKRNATITEQIIENVTKYNKDGILLMATNPVDVLSYVAWKKSGIDMKRVIGSGTLLDSARFRYLIGQNQGVDPRSVHAHIIGEHGDSEVPVWSHTNIAGVEVELPQETKDVLYYDTKHAAYDIIKAKGATYYAIALALDRICRAILRNEGSVLNVSTLLENYHGISDVYLSVPCVVDRKGIRQALTLPLNEQEKQLLQQSAQTLKDQIASLEIS